MEYEGDGDTNCNRHSPQRLGKGTERVENQRMNRDHQNDNIVDISHYIENRPGHMSRFAVTRTPGKKSPANSGVQNTQGV